MLYKLCPLDVVLIVSSNGCWITYVVIPNGGVVDPEASIIVRAVSSSVMALRASVDVGRDISGYSSGKLPRPTKYPPDTLSSADDMFSSTLEGTSDRAIATGNVVAGGVHMATEGGI
jgi:hypothetical protein